ncbi:MAG TPA: phosphoenolpyruvate--protein phosphotransferase [Anaerolineales bacterium]|nr:phosphoenolpyruvate--protein phosphotransferase [Anaerolineales bacterium]
MRKIQAIPISPGIAQGPIFHYGRSKVLVEKLENCDPDQERARLQSALEQAAIQLKEIRKRAIEEVSAEEALIFEAQEMFLSDPALVDQVFDRITSEACNAEFAWQEGTEFFANMLANLEDEYLSARAADVRDVGQRVLRLLTGASDETSALFRPAIILADDLTPSDTVMFDKSLVLGFCTAQGGPTSHAAILSRALGIPAVVGIGDWLDLLASSKLLLLDGTTGELIIDPDSEQIAHFQARSDHLQSEYAQALKATQDHATTPDGRTIEIAANLGSPSEAEQALELGAEGVGLFRTEFLFLDRITPPDEEEQIQAYQQVLQAFTPHPVIFRTLDIGGDKPAPYLDLPQELNPFLGLRGARLTITRPELFKTQLRALLRAGAGYTLQVMFPMVDSLADVLAARQIIEQSVEELKDAGLPHAIVIRIGIMVEVPSAAIMADVLADAVDFFSIGTNDLSQYTMAADRTNSAVAVRADALEPAVLRLIQTVIDAAHTRGRWVGLCGELGGDPLAAALLVGLGIDELSMNARAIPLVKAAIRNTSFSSAEKIAHECLKLKSASEVRNFLRDKVSGNTSPRTIDPH